MSRIHLTETHRQAAVVTLLTRSALADCPFLTAEITAEDVTAEIPDSAPCSSGERTLWRVVEWVAGREVFPSLWFLSCLDDRNRTVVDEAIGEALAVSTPVPTR